jgi:uncharacterized membrane protein YfcA
MEISHYVGYGLALFVGITLGLIGSGGSILSVPILVYVMGVEPVLATAYSLFVVGITALVGGVQKAYQKAVDFQKVILFGIPTIIAVFITRRFVVPIIPDIIWESQNITVTKSSFIMVVFALVMIFSALKMIKGNNYIVKTDNYKINYFQLILQGVLIGLVAGFVGAGGGFLIVPALLFLTRIPMKIAVGTSLCIVAMQSLIGFSGDLQTSMEVDWRLILIFSCFAIIGIFIGNKLSSLIKSDKLKLGLGCFLLIIGISIFLIEIIGEI